MSPPSQPDTSALNQIFNAGVSDGYLYVYICLSTKCFTVTPVLLVLVSNAVMWRSNGRTTMEWTADTYHFTHLPRLLTSSSTTGICKGTIIFLVYRCFHTYTCSRVRIVRCSETLLLMLGQIACREHLMSLSPGIWISSEVSRSLHALRCFE